MKLNLCGVKGTRWMLVWLVTAVLVAGGLAVHPVAAQDEEEPTSPVGDYTVALSLTDIPTDVVNAFTLIGRWQITFAEDGTYQATRQDVGPLVTGSYEVSGNEITITDESGLLSCAGQPVVGQPGEAATGTYAWEFDSEGLLLSPLAEPCAVRSVLLSLRPLADFVACVTDPIPIFGEAGATDELPEPPGMEDEAEEPETDAGEPEAAEVDRDAALGPAPPEEGGDDGAGADDGIDALLAQVTACWATGDPAIILALFAEEYLDTLVAEVGSLEEAALVFAEILGVPFTFERAGEVQLGADGETATAVVRVTIGIEDIFNRFAFVLEDGQWRLGDFGQPTTDEEEPA